MNIRLSIKVTEQQLLAITVGCAIILLLIDNALFHFQTLIPEKIHVLFDITLEGNLPTWYSVMLAWMAAIMCAFITAHYYQCQKKLMWLSWLFISLFFAYLSVDDASQFHERIATVWAAQHTSGASGGGMVSETVKGFDSYHWQLLFLPIFGLFGLYMAVIFYREVTGRARVYLAMGLASFVVAVLLDYAEGVDAFYSNMSEAMHFSIYEIEHIFRALEEFIEMVGLSFFLLGFLLHYHRLTSADST